MNEEEHAIIEDLSRLLFLYPAAGRQSKIISLDIKVCAVSFLEQLLDQLYEWFSRIQVFFSWRGGSQSVDEFGAGVVAEQ